MTWLLIKKLNGFTLITAFFISLLATPVVIFIYHRLGWVDDPNKRKRKQDLHQQPLPRGGGIPIFLALLISSLIFLPLDKHLKGILLGITIMVIMGTLDDIFDLNPYLRLFLGFLAAGGGGGGGDGGAFFYHPL